MRVASDMSQDDRLFFPATTRNREPIAAALLRLFAPPVARVLEVASGSGEHALHFAQQMPWLSWQPSDLEPAHLRSIEAWRVDAGTPNLLAPQPLDVAAPPWADAQFDALFCANMIHIAPPEATIGLLTWARALVAPGGLLVLYGPFRVQGRHTSTSNESFDVSLQARDPSWGVRDLQWFEGEAVGFRMELRVAMPANNLLVAFRRTGGQT
jgi:SAM-dependent methyltransferase